MEMSYVNDGIYRFLEARLGSKADIKEKGLICKLKMLEKNDISYLISPYENEMDGNLILRFNTKSYYVFDRFLQRKKPDGEFLRLFLIQLEECINKMEEYMLSPNDIVLQPMYMYVDARENRVRLICVPGYEIDLRIQIKGILEYMMKIFDHHDQSGVKLLYDLYDKATEEDFDIKNYLHSEKKTKEQQVVNHIVNPVVEQTYIRNVPIYNHREQEVFEEGVNDIPTVKQKISLVLLFLGSTLSCFAYIIGGHKVIWLGMSLLLFAVCATELLIVCRDIKHDREIKEDMETYKLVHSELQREAVYENELLSNVIDHSVVQEKDEKKTGRIPTKLVPLSNGALAVIEIKADGVLVVGRGKDSADYVLDRTQISRIHARLYRGDGKLALCDAGSTNGTFVNYRRLDAQMYVELKAGDIVSFADEEFFVA